MLSRLLRNLQEGGGAGQGKEEVRGPRGPSAHTFALSLFGSILNTTYHLTP